MANTLIQQTPRPVQYVPEQTEVPGQRIAQYKLVMRQQPIHARLCGYGNKDRRSVDPQPILELLEYDAATNDYISILTPNHYFITKVSLWSADREYQIESSSKVPIDVPLLAGDIIEPAHILTDDKGHTGTFFVFSDISIRANGIFSLKFSFADLERQNEALLSGKNSLADKSTYLCHEFSDEITVFMIKDFPGMMDSTELVKAFRNQGVKIGLRKTKEHVPIPGRRYP